MSDYGMVLGTFWTGQTGKKIRAEGKDAMIVALYLMTNPHRSALGLYYLPLPLISHETGIPLQGTKKALQSIFEAGFGAYDEASEMVWVYNMARFQIAPVLKESDNRVRWINTKYMELPNNPFLQAFYEKYAEAFHLNCCRKGEGVQSPLKAPSKPDTDTDTDTDKKTYTASVPDAERAPTLINEKFYPTRKKRKLTGKRLESFNRFWDVFNYKRGKAEAADAWLEIPELTKTLVDTICNAAEAEAKRRDDLVGEGQTPKMAEGWIRGRRWEDEITSTHSDDDGIDWERIEAERREAGLS